MTITRVSPEATVTERTAENAGFRRRALSEALVLEAAQLMGRAFKGSRRHMHMLEESLSSDDFRAAAFEVLDREMMERYQDLPRVWDQYARRTTVKDFKPKRIVDLMGGQAGLEKVPELAPYPARSLSKALYQIFVEKFGGRFQISWEAIVNDELGQLQDLPGALATGANDTESMTAAALLTDGNGPNGALFNATAWGRTFDEQAGTFSGGSSNLITGNPLLSIDSLADAMRDIKLRRDPEGRPIMVPRFKLVVPQALEVDARRVLATKEIRTTVGGVETIEDNWVAGMVDLVVEPWLDVLDKGTNAQTTWYLVPAPASSRPALYVAFLRGYEAPDLRVKADGGQRPGGGEVAPEEGSFDVDDIEYRVRHVVGSAGTDMIATAVSTGAGA